LRFSINNGGNFWFPQGPLLLFFEGLYRFLFPIFAGSEKPRASFKRRSVTISEKNESFLLLLVSTMNLIRSAVAVSVASLPGSYLTVAYWNYRQRRAINVYNAVWYVESMYDGNIPECHRKYALAWAADLSQARRELHESLLWPIRSLPVVQGNVHELRGVWVGDEWYISSDSVTRLGMVFTSYYPMPQVIHLETSQARQA
jgi:hypothetical protein